MRTVDELEPSEAPETADTPEARATRFARLVALEAECARLRAELATGPRAATRTALPSSAAWTLIEGLASDFLSVHAFDGTYVFASRSCARILGHEASALVGRASYDFIHPEDIDRVATAHATHLERAEHPPIEYRMRRADGAYVWVETRANAAVSAGEVAEIVCITRDVTERHAAEEAQRALIAELERRVEQVRTLTGLLPICAWCKSIRDDAGYWHELEAYFHKSSRLEFTHGACPDCAARVRASLADGTAR